MELKIQPIVPHGASHSHILDLIEHNLWWNGPERLCSVSTIWPKQSPISTAERSEEKRKICSFVTTIIKSVLLSIDRYSSFTRRYHVTAWILRFMSNSYKWFKLSHISLDYGSVDCS